MDVFHGWVLALITSVVVIVAMYVSAMWFLSLLDPKPRSRKRPWRWRVLDRMRRRK